MGSISFYQKRPKRSNVHSDLLPGQNHAENVLPKKHGHLRKQTSQKIHRLAHPISIPNTRARCSSSPRKLHHQVPTQQSSPEAKPLVVLTKAIFPSPKNSTSQSVEPNPPTTPCTANPFIFPNPHETPADRDNNSLWESVMANTKVKAAKAGFTAESVGARGTAAFEAFLIKLLGHKLHSAAAYLTSSGPSEHFDSRLQGKPPVEKYVTMYSGEMADLCARAMGSCVSWPHTEADLAAFWVDRILSSDVHMDLLTGKGQISPFDEKTIKRASEHRGPFQAYDISDLREGLADIRFIRLSPQERLDGRSAANTPTVLPAEKDLRGRYDMVFGIHNSCLPLALIDEDFPCHDRLGGIFSIWLRIEFKRDEDADLINTARHQWAVGALLELQSRVRMIRDGQGKSYLLESSDMAEFRQYGYVVCGAYVEVWEMCVIYSRLTQAKKRRETYLYDQCFQFPAKVLAKLRLDGPEGVTGFCDWHAKIMTWGFEIYSRQYLNTVRDLQKSKIAIEDWTLSYEEAIGTRLPPLITGEEQSDVNPPLNACAALDPDSTTLLADVATIARPSNVSNTRPVAATDEKQSNDFLRIQREENGRSDTLAIGTSLRQTRAKTRKLDGGEKKKRKGDAQVVSKPAKKRK